MFERPGVQDQFPKYKGKGVGEVKDAITAHGKKVVEQLVQFVKEADNKSVLDGMVADFIALHKKNNIPHSSLAVSLLYLLRLKRKHIFSLPCTSRLISATIIQSDLCSTF